MGISGRSLALILVMVVAACSPRPVAMRAVPDPAATIVPVFGVSGRRLDTGGSLFGNDRPQEVQHFRIDVSVPPTHRPGRIAWPKVAPDAATDFVVTEAGVYPDARALIADMRRTVPGQETLLFVHGYNSTLSEATFRMAQIITDFEVQMPGVLFAWPSAGDPRGYLYDRDSVLFARDDLERTIRDLTARPGDRVFLLAHSMGSHLTMETLRQISLKGDRRLLDRLSGVVLVAPDIDPDIFARQAEVIGTLPQPFLIFITQRDRALTFSGFITGRKPRLGVIAEAGEVVRPDVQVVDVTDLSEGGAALNHSVPLTSPTAISLLNAVMTRAEREGRGLLRAVAEQLPLIPTSPR
ncbi:alpha/beta hydrolase [Roseovarius autotrophicus]|uniref:alpha/beta hydrolase n=1 Tax=Roseovarius autotrophicus TaxID=2824121 RepID=UPI001B37E342|nr:alpha/beta fold hydrolase [Roseovarius autotrophicus]